MQHEPRLLITTCGLATALALGACSDEFDPYNQVQGFRLLAIAADRPTLAPGDSAELGALLTIDDSDVAFEWSWCPLTAGLDRAYECAVTREELQAAADAALGPGVVVVPPLSLGSAPTATFTHDVTPEFFRAICDVLRNSEIPQADEVLFCDGSYPMTIRLEVEASGQVIVGVKELELLYEEGANAPNQNPLISEAFAFHPDRLDTEIAIAADGSTLLAREVEYLLRLDIPAAGAEPYDAPSRTGGPPESRVEDLVITWFVEAGETDVMRTAFLDGEISLEQASENRWTTPSHAELGADTARLYFVIRDNRGGTSWLSRAVRLED